MRIPTPHAASPATNHSQGNTRDGIVGSVVAPDQIARPIPSVGPNHAITSAPNSPDRISPPDPI